MALKTVCIVDDDQPLRNALAFALSTLGYAVREFADADMALDCLDMPSEACLVVDHRLPRLDGLFVIEALRARGMGARAILITSIPAASLSKRCDCLGIPLVEKPLIEDELHDAIARAFGDIQET